MATENRKEQGRKGIDKGRFSKEKEYDSDIQREIDKGLAINILYDSSGWLLTIKEAGGNSRNG